MSVNFGALDKRPGGEPAVRPRDIFTALPNKPRGMDYLRRPQDEVLQEWWSRRDARDLVIKMNTGGGKTIVGLLAAQSSLAEGVGPAAYLVPDHYLVDLVTAEGRRLGTIRRHGDGQLIAFISILPAILPARASGNTNAEVLIEGASETADLFTLADNAASRVQSALAALDVIKAYAAEHAPGLLASNRLPVHASLHDDLFLEGFTISSKASPSQAPALRSPSTTAPST